MLIIQPITDFWSKIAKHNDEEVPKSASYGYNKSQRDNKTDRTS